MQAPNRKGIWSRSQQPRAKAMVGPRFEQTIMADQVSAHIRRAMIIDIGAQDVIYESQWLTSRLSATTIRRHRPHPQATRALDQRSIRLM